MCFLCLLCPMYPALQSHWNSSQQNLSAFLGQNLTAVCQHQPLDPSAIFFYYLLFEICSSEHLWLSPLLMLLLLTEGSSSSPHPPTLCWFHRYLSLVSSSSAPIPFSRQLCLRIQTQVSLLWQWLTSLLQTFLLSKSKISGSDFDIYSLMVSHYLKLTMNF